MVFRGVRVPRFAYLVILTCTPCAVQFHSFLCITQFQGSATEPTLEVDRRRCDAGVVGDRTREDGLNDPTPGSSKFVAFVGFLDEMSDEFVEVVVELGPLPDANTLAHLSERQRFVGLS